MRRSGLRKRKLRPLGLEVIKNKLGGPKAALKGGSDCTSELVQNRSENLEAIPNLEAPVSSHRIACRTGDSTVVQFHIVEERIQHVAVAVVARENAPGIVRMVEHVEDIETNLEPLTFKRKLERLIQAQIHLIESVSAENVAARQPRPSVRIDYEARVGRIYGISVRIDVTGRRRYAEDVSEDGNRIRRSIRVSYRRPVIEALSVSVQIETADEWCFDVARLNAVNTRKPPIADHTSYQTLLRPG